ncbi:uncharacterized protein LOC116201072 isoform X2 [Punica granatum]|uniref:Uncharacterized protein n=2 Tax=Punica granatum TaxID=22663 RepID=A0A2I0K934_PUNGR|nr:uncharacterized protein LOC116201072 isoform X2 [Punica granatum]PKI64613.1 hypothetical protein CRG98_015045 [Punica granatum]
MMMMQPTEEGVRDNPKVQKQMPHIHSFKSNGMPVYFFREPGEKHCYWDVCDCGDCDIYYRKKRKGSHCFEEAQKKADPKPDPDPGADENLSTVLKKKKVLPCYKPILKWVRKQKWEDPEEIRDYLKDMVPASISERLVHKMEQKGKLAATPSVTNVSLSVETHSRKSFRSKLDALNEVSYLNEDDKISSTDLPLINPYIAFSKQLSFSPIRSIRQLIRQSPHLVKEYVQSTRFDQHPIQALETEQLLWISSMGKRILQTDASDRYWGAVLLEELNGKRHICGYRSGRFKPLEQQYHSTFKEILAIINGIKKFEFHLMGYKFLVEMDMSSFPKMLQFKQKQLPHPQLLRWVEWFSKFDFEVKHIKGKHNTLADFLSRKEQALTR